MVLLARLFPENAPQRVRLDEILVGDLVHERQGMCGPRLVGFGVGGLPELDGTIGCDIVGVCAVIAIDAHRAVSLEVENWAAGFIDWDLLVVDTETVAVGVGVGKEAGLQDWIG